MTLHLDRSSLLRGIRAGEEHDFILFWGHTPRRDGALSDACFSQWYHAPFAVDGVEYPTAEHWMMASKARLFSDSATLAKILAAPSPAAAKKLGREVSGFVDATWRQHRFDPVTRGNVAKFSSSEALRAYLLDTGDTVLVEASPTDTIWGIGLDAKNPASRDPARWRGENLLGFALMAARETLRAERRET